jgi:hypothetical protein
MFLLHLGAPEGKDHLILPEHLSGEGRYYPSVAPKWRRNILSFRCMHRNDKMFLLQFGAPEG